MAGNETKLSAIETKSGVTNADIWAALDQLEVGSGAEETPRDEANEAEVPTEDIGHGAEVKGATTEADSAGGENAGEEETEEVETGQEEADEEPAEDVEEEVAEAATTEETEEEVAEQPKGIRDMEKRIGKLTARNKGLEEEAATLRSQLEKAQPIILQPTEADPMAHLNSEREVNAKVQSLRDLRGWCIKNFDGGELPTNEGPQYRSAEEVRDMLVKCESMIEHAPARVAYLKQKAGADEQCKTAYPELFDAKSVESQIAWAFVNENPGILRRPDYALIIGDAIRGAKLRAEEAKARQARQAAAVKPAAGRPAFVGQKIAPRAISPAAAQSIRGNGATQAHQRFMETGNKKDGIAFLERMLGT